MSMKNPKIAAAAEKLKAVFKGANKDQSVGEQAITALGAISSATIIDQFSRSLILGPGEPPSRAHVLGAALLLTKWARESEEASLPDVSFKDVCHAALDTAIEMYNINEQLANELTDDEKKEVLENLVGRIEKASQPVDPNQN